MSRTVAVVWHASSCVVAGVLYFFFVLPRWPELMGQTPHTLGTVLRIVVAVLIGQATLPVLFTLLRTRRPEFRTPQLALTLRAWSIGLHVLAAVLVLGTAITEIWVSLDDAGRWLFGIYAAAAAIALLGIFAFYLAWVAEAPPPPPKPVKPKSGRQRRRGRKGPEENSEESSGESTEEPTGESAEDVEETTSAEDTTEDTNRGRAVRGQARRERGRQTAQPSPPASAQRRGRRRLAPTTTTVGG